MYSLTLGCLATSGHIYRVNKFTGGSQVRITDTAYHVIAIRVVADNLQEKCEY